MWHWLSYVLPSAPHTGCRMKGHEHGWVVVEAVLHSPSCALLTPLGTIQVGKIETHTHTHTQLSFNPTIERMCTFSMETLFQAANRHI